MGTKVGVPLEKYSKEKQGSGSCPRCKADITLAQMRKAFTIMKDGKEVVLASNEILQNVADTYNKYMKDLKMDTCWIKAHFFCTSMTKMKK